MSLPVLGYFDMTSCVLKRTGMLVLAGLLVAQSPPPSGAPVKEYIRVGGRLVAVEYTAPPVQMTSVQIRTSPDGLMVSIDGAAPERAPVTKAWQPGSSHTISVAGMQDGAPGERFRFKNWDNNSQATQVNRTISIPAVPSVVYTAAFDRELYLDMQQTPASSGATLTPGPGWRLAGNITIDTTVPSGLRFLGWTGAFNSPSMMTTFNLSAPGTVTAAFEPAPPGPPPPPTLASVSFTSSPSGLLFILDGNQEIKTPATINLPIGSNHTVLAMSPQVIAATGYSFSNWAGRGATAQISFVATGLMTLNATFTSTGPALQVTPGAAVVQAAPNAPKQLFTASSAVTWSLVDLNGAPAGNAGSLSLTSGTSTEYTPPSSVSSPVQVLVRATSALGRFDVPLTINPAGASNAPPSMQYLGPAEGVQNPEGDVWKTQFSDANGWRTIDSIDFKIAQTGHIKNCYMKVDVQSLALWLATSNASDLTTPASSFVHAGVLGQSGTLNNGFCSVGLGGATLVEYLGQTITRLSVPVTIMDATYEGTVLPHSRAIDATGLTSGGLNVCGPSRQYVYSVPVTISNVQVAPESTGATITWDTAPSASTHRSVAYSKLDGTGGGGFETPVAYASPHTITVTGLQPGVTYRYDVSNRVSGTSVKTTASGTLTTTHVNSGSEVLRVNAGGGETFPWKADFGYSDAGPGTSTTSNPIVDAQGLPLSSTLYDVYKSQRLGAQRYRFFVPVRSSPNHYAVTLRFAELYYTSPNSRNFHVTVNGAQVLTNFNVYSAAGAAFKAVDRTVIADGSSGLIDIAFTSATGDNPVINGIEIAPTSFSPIRVNAGKLPPPAGPTIGSGGKSWSDDFGFTGGTAWLTGNPITNAALEDVPLYRTQRLMPPGSPPKAYQFGNLPCGLFDVTLKFAEIYYPNANGRNFDVRINGNTMLSNFNVFSAALQQVGGTSGTNVAIDRTFQVHTCASNSTVGQLTIEFASTGDNAIINAIEILPSRSPVRRVNVGTRNASLPAPAGGVWAADESFIGAGSPLNAPGNEWYNGDAPIPYQTQRYGELGYDFVVQPGTYSVNLKFAELYYSFANSRNFHVTINGAQVLSNFNAFTAAGGWKIGVDRTFTVSAPNGQITIQILKPTPSSDNPIINAIEITKQ